MSKFLNQDVLTREASETVSRNSDPHPVLLSIPNSMLLCEEFLVAKDSLGIE